MNHTIESIREALQKGPDADQALELVWACEPLRAVRRERIRDLTPMPNIDFERQPAAYREALLNDALMPDVERDRLAAEIQQLNALESLASTLRQKALDDKARAEIPKALKRLPKNSKAVADAVAALNAAIEVFNADAECLGEYDRLMEKPHTPADDELAAMLELRNALWQPRQLRVPFTYAVEWDPDSTSAKSFPKSWQLLYERRGARGSTVVSRKPPTQGLYLPDYADAVVPTHR